MRLIKMLGLAAVAAVAAMALVGATSASAANTELCNSHSALTCGSAATSVSMTNVGVSKLLNSLATILCLESVYTASPIGSGDPQPIAVLLYDLRDCGTNSAHTNCEAEVTDLPSLNLNKTGLDAGTLTSVEGTTFVACEDVVFSTDIECEYDLTGVQLSIGAQHATANETPFDEIGSDFLCPDSPTLDVLLATTSNRYVLAP